ncbi:uncharacterized protein A4U43_C02F15110 [Asparagus officinalis]|uniref:Uncharacterized protein n=1 Tax=Asparagus officinalis TaxID=4686 RepID=A0A5P1FMF6_ASPOF|nr:uncharacterized protein A4U43_C02F15110 [Asparagus officinalis]
MTLTFITSQQVLVEPTTEAAQSIIPEGTTEAAITVSSGEEEEGEPIDYTRGSDAAIDDTKEVAIQEKEAQIQEDEAPVSSMVIMTSIPISTTVKPVIGVIVCSSTETLIRMVEP